MFSSNRLLSLSLERELSSDAVVSLQAAFDCCSSGVTELQDVLVPGLRNDVGLLQEALDRCSSGVTELQDAVLPGLRDDVNRCSSGVDELRLELVPKLQVDVERYSALSLRLDDLANRFNGEFRALERNTASLTQGVVKFAQVVGILSSGSTGSSGGGSLELLSWEECAVNLKRRVEETWQQSFRTILSMVLKCRTSLAEVDRLTEQCLRFEAVAERVSVIDDWLEGRFGRVPLLFEEGSDGPLV